MDSKDVINELALTKRNFCFNGNVTLEPYKSHPDSWIQYGTCQMREGFGTPIHFEITKHYSRICIYLHDERRKRDCLWDKLHEIAKWHGLEQGESINFCCPEKINDLNTDMAWEHVTQGLHEIFRVFNPFFERILSGGSDDRESRIRGYQVEGDILSSSDVIRRLVYEDIPLELDAGFKMQPNKKRKEKKRKECDRYTGYRIYKSYLDNDLIHFEVRTEDNEICVELHDERNRADSLYLLLYQEAVKNKLEVNKNDTGLWIGFNTHVACNRSWKDITDDIAGQMNFLWGIFGEMLGKMSPEGAVKQKDSIMPLLAELPQKEYDSNVICRQDIDIDILCWVTTVEEFVNRDPIQISNIDLEGKKMRPGEYIIPQYQRRYAWTQDNVTQLCRDLLRAYNQNRHEYHLGTLIFHAPKNDANSFYVVDGQQRLRTISRLLSQKIFAEREESLLGRQFSNEDEKRIWESLRHFRDDKEKILDMLKRSTFVCIAVSDITESFQLFSTQNGRGKTLSPENLLKAYHFHEIHEAEEFSPEQLDEIDETWEKLNQQPTINDGMLLRQVIGEHLYRIRCWLRGDFPREPFSSKMVNAFKGLTVNTRTAGENVLPLGNLSILRRNGDEKNELLAHRFNPDNMNPFVFIDQPIVNGSDFFSYVCTYCNAYEVLFERKNYNNPDLDCFYDYYSTYCLYPYSGRRGDVYARHIFQSLCLYCYDRFGVRGLMKSFEYLYCCAYFERVTNARCYYQTCGRTYAVSAIQIMAGATNLPDLTDRLCALSLKAREQFETQGSTTVNGLECVYTVFSKED